MKIIKNSVTTVSVSGGDLTSEPGYEPSNLWKPHLSIPWMPAVGQTHTELTVVNTPNAVVDHMLIAWIKQVFFVTITPPIGPEIVILPTRSHDNLWLEFPAFTANASNNIKVTVNYDSNVKRATIGAIRAGTAITVGKTLSGVQKKIHNTAQLTKLPNGGVEKTNTGVLAYEYSASVRSSSIVSPSSSVLQYLADFALDDDMACCFDSRADATQAEKNWSSGLMAYPTGSVYESYSSCNKTETGITLVDSI